MSVLGSDPDVPVSELLSELLNRKMLYELLQLKYKYGFHSASSIVNRF